MPGFTIRYHARRHQLPKVRCPSCRRSSLIPARRSTKKFRVTIRIICERASQRLIGDQSRVTCNQVSYTTDLCSISSMQCHSHIRRSVELTSELQSLMRNSYAVFCLSKKYTTPHLTYPNS